MPAVPPEPAERTPDPLLSVVLPVYNEAGVLLRLRHAIEAALDECDVRYEIVFVNDGSGDGSTGALDGFARDDDRIRVVHLSRNFGHQAAVHAGLEHAIGDAVVVMDSDLQDDPRAIRTFLDQWRNGYDVVYAIRRARKEGPIKRCLFGSFYRVLGAVSEIPIPRDAGNFGLVDRRVVAAILRMGDTDRFLPGLRRWVGFRQIGVEVERLARYDHTPRVSLFGLFRLAKSAIFSFSRFPLTVFAAIAVVAGVVGTVATGVALVAWFGGTVVPAGTGLVAAAAWVSCLNALGIAVLGEYVGRIHDSVRARPAYVVDRIVSSSAPLRPRPDVDLEELLRTVDALYNERETWVEHSSPEVAGSGR